MINPRAVDVVARKMTREVRKNSLPDGMHPFHSNTINMYRRYSISPTPTGKGGVEVLRIRVPFLEPSRAPDTSMQSG
jgi:hypothetical protein